MVNERSTPFTEGKIFDKLLFFVLVLGMSVEGVALASQTRIIRT